MDFGERTLGPTEVGTILTFMDIHKNFHVVALHESARMLGARVVTCKNCANLTEDVYSL